MEKEKILTTARMLEDIYAECEESMTEWERGFVDDMLHHGSGWTERQAAKIRQIYRTRVLGLREP